MELEFDKEIDALMRKARSGSPAVAGTSAGTHLDADELAAFAENALPDRTRQMYVAHLADCDTCRKTLSGFISMNPEAAPDAAFVAAAAPAAAPKLPWYRALLATANLAYTMGGLVIVFSGLIGLLVWQNRMAGGNAELSQVRQTAANSNASSVESRPEAFSNSSAVSNSSANANSSSPIDSVTKTGVAVGQSNTATVDGTGVDEEKKPAPKNEVAATEPNATTSGTGGVTLAAPSSAADTAKGQPVTPTEREVKEDDRKLKTEVAQENKVLVDKDARDRMDSQVQNNAGAQIQNNTRDMSPGAQSAKRAEGQKQVQSQTTQRQVNDLPVGGRSLVTSIKTAGGKKFEFRDGIWYDTAYTGQGKKDYKRGTEKYIRLDAGLRSIADQIGGTVVVVWNGTAYKIK